MTNHAIKNREFIVCIIIFTQCIIFAPDNSDCYDIFRSSYKHYAAVVDLPLSTISLMNCAEECARTPSCGSFSYRRYGSTDSNCLVSRLEADDISIYSDLVSDSQWDVYEFAQRRTGCSTGGGGGGGTGNGGKVLVF